MTTTPDEPLGDDEMETSETLGGGTAGPRDSGEGDADGTDGGDADGTDGATTDGTVGSDADGTDGTDG